MTTCLNCGHSDEQGFAFCPQCGTKAPEGEGAGTLIGRTLSDKYRVVSEIGSGAMGTVYLGEHVVLKGKVALKVLHPDLRLSDEQLQRFQREGIAAGKFSHPNAIQIFDFDKSGGTIYLAMEFVEGSNLRLYLRKKGKLSVRSAVQLTREVLDCLAEAHRHGIVHRDLKPDNIMVAPGSREELRVKVLDFGLSKLVALGGQEQSSLVTQVGRILGTPLYMSPEQCAGEETDARSDLYAVGLILYEMVSGLRPFHEESTTDLLFSRATKEAPSLLGEFPDLDLPSELDQVITRALARKRQERFQTAEEMISALETIPLDPSNWSRGTSVSRSVVAPAPVQPAARGEAAPRRRLPLLVGGLVLLAVAAGMFLFQGDLGIAPLGAPRAVRARDVPVEDRSEAQVQYLRMLDLADVALRSGSPVTASQALNDALASEAVDSEAYLLQAELYRSLGDDDAALASFRSALELDPGYVDARMGMGRMQRERGALDEAEETFRRALEDDPDSSAARTALGVLAYDRGRRDEARDAFDAVLESDPGSGPALLYSGRMLLDDGDAAGAAERLVEAKLAEKGDWRAPAWLGEAYLELGRRQDAEQQWRAALELEDGDATVEVRRDLGTLLVSEESFAEATRFLQDSTASFGDDGELSLLLSLALLGRGDDDGARAALEQAVRLGVSGSEPATLLAMLLHADGRSREALRHYDDVLEAYGEVPRANFGRGVILFENGDYVAAREAFRSALAYDSTSLGAHLYLGMLAMDYFGDAEEAKRSFEAYQRLGGDDPRVSGWLQAL